MVREYHKRHFLGLYCLKKKLEKWPFLDQNHGLPPLEKCQFSTFLTSCFYSVKRRFFVLEYHKRQFSGLYCLKKVSKMVIFGPKPWVNPFEKNVHFSTVWTCCFYSLEKPFFVLEYHKRHFSFLYCLKKKVKKWPTPFEKPLLKNFNCKSEKWPNFGRKLWVNPFGKMSIFRLF